MGYTLLIAGMLALLGRPSSLYIAREGLRAWRFYSVLWILCGVVAAFGKTWWPILACPLLMWTAHKTLHPWFTQHRIPEIAVLHIRAMGQAYTMLRMAFPWTSPSDIMKLLVAGDPSRGLAGRYDEEHETELRNMLIARIEVGVIQSPLALVTESLIVEGKIVPAALSPRMVSRWAETITTELEGCGIPREEIIGAEVR